MVFMVPLGIDFWIIVANIAQQEYQFSGNYEVDMAVFCKKI